METDVELGDTVKCKYTGFNGVAVAKQEFINGCIQFVIAAKYDKKNPIQDEMIDSQSLIILKKAKKEKIEEEDEEEDESSISTGGPTKRLKRSGY